MIYNASAVDASRDFGNKYYYFHLQLRWAALGIIAMVLIRNIDPQKLLKISLPLSIVAISLLFLVLIPGIGNKYLGARRWIGVGGFTIQPAEAAKFALVVYLSSVLSKKTNLSPLITSLVLTVGLIMLEPDLGTSIVITMTAIIIYFASGGSLYKLGLSLVAISVLGLILIMFSPYRRSRLMTFFDPNRDPQGSSYHIRQALIAFGNGGMFGVGLGQSRQKYQYLPEVTTDSIFAVVGEELGFVGAGVLVMAFVSLTLLGLKISENAPNQFQRLLGVGMIGWISSQAFLNLSAITGLMPLTGVPLPLISYGGSSLVVALASIGVLLSIDKHAQ
jgi:cell division protein FtsW